MTFFISAGEPSGDLHAGNLIRALRAKDSRTHVMGFGGPLSTRAGAELLYPLTDLALMGVRRVVRHIPTFIRLANDAERAWQRHRPDAVVLIDYPGFNFHLGKRAQARGLPVYYFVPPQLWAWRRGRVRQVRKWCTKVLTALPFEDDWYRSRGVATEYVGHPYFDELTQQQLDPDFLNDQRSKTGRVIALLPGSRNQEVAANFDMMLAAAAKIQTHCPDVRFLVGAFNDRHATAIRTAASRTKLSIEVHVGRTPEVIELAEACIAVSGSVSLELMYRAKPSVIVYRMNAMSLWLARRLVKLPYFTLVNLLASEQLYPEIATARDESARIADHVLGWLNDPTRRFETVRRIAALRDRVAQPGACNRAAELLLGAVKAIRGAA